MILKSYADYRDSLILESTSLNVLNISQKAIKRLSGGVIKSHKIVFAPLAGTKADLKNELVKGKSVVAKKDADNFIIVRVIGSWKKDTYQVIVITNSDIEMNKEFSMTKALGFITKDYNEYFTFSDYENRDPSRDKKDLGRGSNNEEPSYSERDFAEEKWVQDFVLKIVETQLANLRNEYIAWLKTYDGSTKFQAKTPIGVTNWDTEGIYRIKELAGLAKAIKGQGEFGGKSGSDIVYAFLGHFLEGSGWSKANGYDAEKNALKQALADLAKTIHWGSIARGYGYYGGTFSSEKQLKDDLK